MMVPKFLSYEDMCLKEGFKIGGLQRGMYYKPKAKHSIFLMNSKSDAPYSDKFEENGDILIYEGHDIKKNKYSSINPKEVDQPMYNKDGSLSQNGIFYKAALDYKKGIKPPEEINVYEKISSGYWIFHGKFKLIDAWIETINNRKVFKFKLERIKSE